MKQISLKNFDADIILDEHVYEFLTTDPEYASINFLQSLRLHSSGCVVFQKTTKQKDGSFSTQTIYLHRLIAEKYKGNERTATHKLAGTINGNKLDCRIENIQWRSRATASRQRKTTSGTGYTGVYGEFKRFRAVISFEGKSLHLGMFDTAEAAAEAYNKKSMELYGSEGKLNIIRSSMS